MAIVVKDRVQETSTTVGTADFVLGGATPGYQSFAAIGNTNTTYYAAVDPATGAWEVGTGTYSTTGPTLTRTTIFESSNSGAKVDFAAGAKNVFCTYPAERAIYEEPSGNTLIDGGPLTVVGAGVPSGGYTTFSAALGEFYGDVDNYAQLYVQNLNDGSDASADFAAYNDISDGETFFVDMGVSSSNASPAGYDLLTPNSTYVIGYGDGDTLNSDMFVGSGDGDLNLFAGGFTDADIGINIDKTTKNVTTAADVDVGGDLNATGGTFTAAVTTSSASAASPANNEFVTKAYVDNATSNGFHVHTPVLVATTGNLTATYNQPGGAGDGVGATLTNSGTQEALEIDGVAMTVADRVLVWQQSTGTQNGVYTVTTVGDGSTNWVLTRATDADEAGEGSPDSLGGGDYFFVNSGATLGFFAFVCTNTDEITFGTSAITFTEFSQVPSYIVNAPLNLTGNVLSLSGTVAATNGGTGTNTVTTGDMLYGSASNTWSKLALGSAYKSLVVNGSGTQVEWNAVALNQSGAVSGALGATNGGTGQSTYAVGDILYSGLANTLSKLAGNTSTTKKFLSQTGTGSDSTAPSWDAVTSSDVSGLGTMATQNANNVAISGGTINGTPIGGSSAAAITGTTVTGTVVTGTTSVVAANGVFVNGTTVSTDLTIGTGQNGFSVGPLTVASGVTLTVASGQRHVVI